MVGRDIESNISRQKNSGSLVRSTNPTWRCRTGQIPPNGGATTIRRNSQIADVENQHVVPVGRYVSGCCGTLREGLELQTIARSITARQSGRCRYKKMFTR